MSARRIGLFFGSFNPVHNGHMIIANVMATQTDLDEVWLVVSPHNPLKPRKSLARDYDRLHLVHLAVGDNPHLRACNIEFGLPRPSYTIDTLVHLREKYPRYEFALIMGSDNLETLPRWKNYELILRDYHIYVYVRQGRTGGSLATHPHVHIVPDVPLLQLSASYIRQCIRQGYSVQYMVPDAVFHYLEASGLYR